MGDINTAKGHGVEGASGTNGVMGALDGSADAASRVLGGTGEVPAFNPNECAAAEARFSFKGGGISVYSGEGGGKKVTVFLGASSFEFELEAGKKIERLQSGIAIVNDTSVPKVSGIDLQTGMGAMSIEEYIRAGAGNKDTLGIISDIKFGSPDTLYEDTY